MKLANDIYVKLLKSKFYFHPEDIPNGERFRLGVGPIITIYQNGTVLVQGRYKPEYQAWAKRTLTRILPKDTRWHVSE